MTNGGGSRLECQEVRTLKTSMICYKCNVEMIRLDDVIKRSPPLYQYECVICNHYEKSELQFPIIEYINTVNDR
jgi:hypothetical protein